jgi:hypothetical protein
MSKKILGLIAVLCAACTIPAYGQSKLMFNLGGGVSTPLNPTGAYTGVSGNFNVGAGYSIDKKNSISGEFMWSGLPTSVFVLHPIDSPSGNINLYTLTVNYRHHIDSIHGSPFGLYGIAGGGWYYRYSSIDKNYVVPPTTVCTPIYYYWGYACDPGGYVASQTVAYKGASSAGLNGGVGFTIRLSDSGWKFYTEARYHYAFSNRIPTTLIPVTMGIRYN